MPGRIREFWSQVWEQMADHPVICLVISGVVVALAIVGEVTMSLRHRRT